MVLAFFFNLSIISQWELLIQMSVDVKKHPRISDQFSESLLNLTIGLWLCQLYEKIASVAAHAGIHPSLSKPIAVSAEPFNFVFSKT